MNVLLFVLQVKHYMQVTSDLLYITFCRKRIESKTEAKNRTYIIYIEQYQYFDESFQPYRVPSFIQSWPPHFFVCLKPPKQFFRYPAAVTITGDWAAISGLCSALRAFEQGGIFIVPHLLRHGTLVYTVSSERPAPTSHSGVRTPNSKIRSLSPTL